VKQLFWNLQNQCRSKDQVAAATSSTVLPIGPGVSCVNEIGTIPDRLIRPTVGFIPTIPLLFDGQTIDPLVSVPIATMHKLADTATPEPELEPHGLRSRT
jgi:hypothetical protein